MVSKINQILLDQSDSDYWVYIFKIRIRGNFKFVVGSCVGEPIIKLQELLLELHKDLNHLAQAKVLVANKVAPDSIVAYEMQEHELLHNARWFMSKAMSDYTELYNIEQEAILSVYHSFIPEVSELVLHEMMPRWSLIDSEIEERRASSVEMSEEYYLTK